ncbi:hypothetical protein S40288_10289 [Stachybotrys chartarum IBT 40288]|nr:hypothetical protein S40288_10289 [Stachybotrys chartarum IBT 40288]
MFWPLSRLADWAPFQLDALGLVTIFGAREMNVSVGSLAHSWVTDWLPILGSYAVANNEIVEPQPGFVLYNVTDGIMAIDLSSWFTRWLELCLLTYSATTIELKMNGRPTPALRGWCALAIGCLAYGALLLLAVLAGDAWGIANVASLLVSVAVRQGMVAMLRRSIDKSIEGLGPDDDVKAFLTLPRGNAVTILGPRMLIVNCLLTNPRPLRPRIYYILRVLGWTAFGAHAITLGMASLFTQILTVALLLVSTYLTAMHVGARSDAVGSRLWLSVDVGDPAWSRRFSYARLRMTKSEEDSMVLWGLMPHRSNTWWWSRYRDTEAARDESEKNHVEATAS